MNKIKKIVSILMLFIIIFCQNKVLGISNSTNRDYSYSKNFLVESIPNKDSTDFKIHLVKGSVATFAREKWKKGDTIVIRLKSIKRNKAELEVGVLPAENLSNGWAYNDYGYPNKKTIKTSEDEVEFTIQADGEYGIYVKDLSKRPDSFLPIFVQKETVSRKTEKNFLEKDNRLDFRNKNYLEFELEVNKTFFNPLTK